jgi:hypothetical protein
MMNVLHFLLGIALWTPGLSVWNVGRNTGLQPALILGLACVVKRFWGERKPHDVPTVLVCAFWAGGLVITVILSSTPKESFNSMVGFYSNLVLILGFALTPSSNGAPVKELLRGFQAGGVASALYAVWQQLALRASLPFGIAPLNNVSFALVTDTMDAIDERSYALCPESSILASLLIPCLMLTLTQIVTERSSSPVRWTILAVLSAGLISCGSLSMAISLPIAILLWSMLSGILRKRALSIAISVAAVAMLVTIALSTWEPAAERLMQVQGRVVGIFDDPSVVMRYSGLVAGWGMFLDSPIFGCGVVPDPALFESYIPAIGYDNILKTGADSILLGLLSGHGLMGAASACTLVVMALRRSYRNQVIFSLLIGLMTVALLQVGYMLVYHLWVFLGVGLSIRPLPSQAGARARNQNQELNSIGMNPSIRAG